MTELAIQMFPMANDTGFVKSHCRRNDPDTSRRAAERAQGSAKGHCQRILDVFAPETDWTAAEIAKVTGLTVEQCARRLPDLKAAGRVDLTGQERDGFRVWAVVA